MERVVIHVDMDYFYAAIEEREDPSLKNKAVVVCMYSGRGESGGAVSTCNYVARETGIKSGIPCARAKAINPDAVFLPVRKDFYKSVSDRVMEILRSHADNSDSFEQVSIDEAFLELTVSTKGDFTAAEDIGNRIKNEVKEKENITCSVGIGPNKIISKMASSVKKPDGLTVIKPEDVKDFFAPMKIKKLWGIGKVTEQKLTDMGIETVGQLAEYDVVDLISVFGKSKGTWLKQSASGIDESPVKDRKGNDQIGRMASLTKDTRDMDMVLTLLDELVDDVMGKLRSRGLSYKLITVTIITSDFTTRTKNRSLSHAISDSTILKQNAHELIATLMQETQLKIRRIGVRVGNLHKSTGQTTLFEYVK